MYDMSAEYVWMRTINILREKLSVFGDDFIAAMIGGNSFESIKDISEDSIIDLAADIGYIISFHPADAFYPDQGRYFFYRANRTPFLPFYLLLILAKHQRRVFCRQLHQPFLFPFFLIKWHYHLLKKGGDCPCRTTYRNQRLKPSVITRNMILP